MPEDKTEKSKNPRFKTKEYKFSRPDYEIVRHYLFDPLHLQKIYEKPSEVCIFQTKIPGLFYYYEPQPGSVDHAGFIATNPAADKIAEKVSTLIDRYKELKTRGIRYHDNLDEILETLKNG